MATVTKLSDGEAESLDASVDASEGPGHSIENFCRRWCDRFGCKTMCVTFGERGCAILKDGNTARLRDFTWMWQTRSALGMHFQPRSFTV